MFSLESPQRGDSNEYTQYTISQYRKVILNYPKSATKRFEIAVVNEPSGLDLSKFQHIKLVRKIAGKVP